MEKQYKNIGFFLLGLLALVILGFSKSYSFLRPYFDRSTLHFVQIHGAALSLWLLLLIIQPLLIRYKKNGIHRVIGKFSYFLIPVIVVFSFIVMYKQYQQGITQGMTGPQSLKTLLIPLFEIVLLTLFYLLAIIYRRDVRLHMRYLICNALILITPSLARVLGFWFGVKQLYSYTISFGLTELILILLIFFDRQHKSNYRPYVFALAFFLLFHIGWYGLGHPF
ncbi:MAG TPA: hypothetical protein VHD35_18380 [Chitinophagaceae bacterium]|nr:hypothetical protein [Chitinophagaceae bacterium]